MKFHIKHRHAVSVVELFQFIIFGESNLQNPAKYVGG